MLPDTDTPSSRTPGPPAPSTLAVFLAQRDEPCPKCGYNLRGVQAAACPECGTTLELAVRRVAPLAGYALFLLLAFGWLFAAGTMNAVRNTRTIIALAQPSQFQAFYSFNTTGSRSVITVAPLRGAPDHHHPIARRDDVRVTAAGQRRLDNAIRAGQQNSEHRDRHTSVALVRRRTTRLIRRARGVLH